LQQWQSEMPAQIPTSRRRVAFTIAIGLIAMVLPVAAADGSAHHTKAFHPVTKTERSLIFRPRHLDGASVVRATVSYKVRQRHHAVNRTRRVSVRRVRHALEHNRSLKVAKPRRAMGGRLLVKAGNEGAERGPVSTSCTFGDFSPTTMPGACWRPFADTSPFNRGVSGASQPAPNSQSIVNRVTGFGGPDKIAPGPENDWSHPIYYSRPSDPLFTVHCTESWGTCAAEGAQIRIPDAARAADGGDAHMAVVDQASGWEYDFWRVQNKPSGGGTLTVSWGGKTRIGTEDSDGLGSDATVSRFALLAGVIRPAELEAGQINHALFMTVKCSNGTWVWPAQSGGGTACSSLGLPNAGAPAIGQHFMLEMSGAEIDALAVPDWQKAILRAMADYGMFVGDTGGADWGIQFESSASYTSFGRSDPWTRLAHRWGLPKYSGKPIFELSDAVNWSQLRVVDPCVAQGSC
jgi:hypothetical protein